MQSFDSYRSGSTWVLVNPPAVSEWDPLPHSYNNPLNLGLLHFAMVLVCRHCKVQILDLQSSRSLSQLTSELDLLPHADYVGISNNFFVTQESTAFIAERILTSRDSGIVVGGSHAGELSGVSPFDSRVRVVPGQATSLVESGQSRKLPLPYHLWPDVDATEFWLDVSQGCHHACAYCLHPPLRLRSLDAIKTDLGFMRTLHNGSRRFTYSTFGLGSAPSHDRAVFKLLKPLDLTFVVQARPDTLASNGFAFLHEAYEAGLRSLWLGLESINGEALVRYGKTNSPDTYVDDALRVCDWCGELGIETHLNLILFDGEGWREIDALRMFLSSHRDRVASIVIGPLMCFPGSPQWALRPEPAQMTGAQRQYFEQRHCYPVKLNDEWTFDESLQRCNEIETAFRDGSTRIIKSWNFEDEHSIGTY